MQLEEQDLTKIALTDIILSTDNPWLRTSIKTNEP